MFLLRFFFIARFRFIFVFCVVCNVNLQQDYQRDQKRLEELDKELKVFDEQQAKRDEEEKIENERKLV